MIVIFFVVGWLKQILMEVCGVTGSTLELKLLSTLTYLDCIQSG